MGDAFMRTMKILAASLLLLPLLAAGMIAGAQTPPLRAFVDMPHARTADTLEVSIRIGSLQAPAPDLFGVGFQLTFDDQAFEFVGHRHGAVFHPYFAPGTAPQVFGPRLETRDGIRHVAYSISLLSGIHLPVAAADGEIALLRFRVRDAAGAGARPFSLQQVARSSTSDPNIRMELLINGASSVGATRRSRALIARAADTAPRAMAGLGQASLMLTRVEQEVELVLAHDLAEPSGSVPRADFLQIAPGFWMLQKAGGGEFGADLCVSTDALLRTPIGANRVVFIGRRTAGLAWEELPTIATPNSYCVSLDGQQDLMLSETSLGTGLDDDAIAERRLALGLFPNPSQGHAEMEYHVEADGPVRIAMFDLLGRSVGVLFDGWAAAGAHRAPLEVDGLAGGTYLVVITSRDARAVRSLVLAR
jgi:hypothetical protein